MNPISKKNLRAPKISRWAILLFLALTTTERVRGACLPQPTGLVSWWSGEFNGWDGISGNNAAAVGDTSYAPGLVGEGFTFDGNSDLFLIGNPTNLQLQDLTIETWIKRASASLASYGSGGVGVVFGYGQGGYSLYMDSGGNLYFAKLGFAGYLSSASVTDTNFHHIAITKSGTSTTFYVDGTSYGGPDFTPTFEFSSDAAIGARGDNYDNSFFGLIDELSVYDHALSAAEIGAIYAAGSAGKCSNPSPPLIVRQPTNQVATVGETARFSVDALGSQPLSFSWFLNRTNLLAESTQVLRITNVTAQSFGDYSVIVSNSYGAITSLVATLTQPFCTTWPTGIVSWWRGQSNVYDHFGKNSGLLVGNTRFTPGRVGSGFSFDGAGDLVTLSNNPSLQLQNFTFESWIKRGSNSLVSYGSGGNGVLFGYGTGGYLIYMDASGKLALSKAGVSVVFSSWSITDTNFHHVAVTKSNTSVLFLLDATSSSLGSFSQTFVFNTPLGIGARPDNSDNSFFGIIDDPTIYQRALTPTELQGIINAQGAGKCADLVMPALSKQPISISVLAGSNATFAAETSGTPPLYWQWRKSGLPIVGATNSILNLTNVTQSAAGIYSVGVSNVVGEVFSSNAVLKVIVVTATGNGLPLTNQVQSFGSNVVVRLQNAYSNGLIFYTLDGSQPSFSSSQYTGPFVVSNSVTLRALGYSADFFDAGELDPITILLPPAYPFTASTTGGGTVSLSPTGGSYLSNTVVTVTASPLAGWQFIGWQGDASGGNAVTNLAVKRPSTVRAIFGTTLSTTAAGGGSVVVNPNGGLLPYGSVVQLSAIPNSGNYFAIWGNAASGNVNPLRFVVTNANPTVSSLFASVSGGQSALSVVPVGYGTVAVSPRANSYAAGSAVSITATPATGQSFTGWSGDATGQTNPLGVTLDQSKLIYANFTAKPQLTGEWLPGFGLRLTLNGLLGAYQVESTTNLTAWVPLGTLTNSFGSAQFTDPTATNSQRSFYRGKSLP